MHLTIETIKPYVLFECVSGSRLFGLATESSDTDIKGVFYLPRADFYGLAYVSQVSNDTNDIVYYELGRFIELLCASNPNILELLNTPSDMILYRHPMMAHIDPAWFLSKAAIHSFAHYAYGQVKKSQGLNKKIVNPVEKERKSVLDFCYVLNGSRSILLEKYLLSKGWQQEYIGLSKITHMPDLYAMYYDEQANYQGVIKKDTSNDILLSSIDKTAPLVGYLSFNKDGYIAYCKQYREYWQWVDKRNEARYQHNITHGRDYDSKNMMHAFRLLYMALDIACYNKIKVWRENREELLQIKQGAFAYDVLLEKANQLMQDIEEASKTVVLPESVNKEKALSALVLIREYLYGHSNR